VPYSVGAWALNSFNFSEAWTGVPTIPESLRAANDGRVTRIAVSFG